MHPEVYAWVARHATDEPVTVLDLGGRDVTGPWGGSPRPLFPNAAVYRVLDIADGPDVDVVADAGSWIPDREYDVVLAVELFEHTPAWPRIIRTAHRALRAGGRLVATMAGPGRPPHGAWGGPWPEPGEHYANIHPDALSDALKAAGFVDITVDQQPAPADVRAVAYRKA